MTSRLPPDNEKKADPLLGCILADRYRVDALLDEGAMGRVFVGEHVLMRKRVAIKLLRRELTMVPEVVSRFEREAMAAAHIEHQNVAAATDFGKLDDGSVFLVLEYIEGRGLRTVINDGPLGTERALRIGRQIASALASAHALNIVHRDLKPENVMLVERGSDADFVKVLDFGIAKVPINVAGASDGGKLITKAGMVFGTPEYMPPEQALGQEVDARADIYSLGVMLYEMLSGRRPFDSSGELGVLGQQLQNGIPRISERAPDVSVPAEVESFVASLLVRESSGRVQTALDVLRGIDALLDGAQPPSSAGRRLLGGQVTELWRDEVTLQRMVSVESLGEARQKAVAFSARASESLSELWRKIAGTAMPLYDASISRTTAWLARAPGPLSRLSPKILVLTVLGLLSGLSLGLLIGVLSSDANETEVPGARAPAAELETASESGAVALAALKSRYQRDPQVLIRYAEALAKGGEHAQAVAELQQALELEPALRDDSRAALTLKQAVGSDLARDAAFELLTGPMQAVGAGIIFELASEGGTNAELQKRAASWLATRDFERNASPQVAIAGALLRAEACAQRKGLLKRAENVGDAHALTVLESFSRGQGCGSSEPQPCNACIVGSPQLQAAIDAIKARQASRKAQTTAR